METTNLYITLKEAENLVFKRFLAVPASRVEITKAQKLYSVNIRINNNGILKTEQNNLIILFSAVNSFEIPEVEKSLFVNNFLIPEGMIIANTRKFKDETDGLFKEENNLEVNPYYTSLRNGCIGVFKEFLTANKEQDFSEDANHFYKKTESLSPFKKTIIKDFIDTNHFPLLKFDPNTFRADKYYRIAWLLKKANEILINNPENTPFQTEEQVAATKNWLKNLLSIENSASVNEFIEQLPPELIQEKAFIFGYFLLAFNYEDICENPKSIKAIRDLVPNDMAEEAYLWAYFFYSMLNKDIIRLYFLKSLQENTIILEKLAYQIALQLEEQLSTIQFLGLNECNSPFEEQIAHLWEIKYGLVGTSPTIIESNKLVDIFNNNLSPDQLQNVGIIAPYNTEYLDVFHNLAYVDNDTFILQLQNPEATFYGEISPKNQAFLKKCNIKPKPIEKLIDAKKKVVVAFSTDKNPMWDFYFYGLGASIQKQFEKMVCIWLVEESPEEMLTTKFGLEKDKLKKQIEDAFNHKLAVELIVKNKNNPNDSEIKRSCFNALKNYKIKEIEVVHDNFTNVEAQWLLHGNTEYYILDKPKNLLTYYNNI